MRESHRYLAVLFAATLTVSVLTTFSANAATQPSVRAVSEVTTAASRAHATRIKRVTPLTATGHLKRRYTLAATRRGRCWTSSFVNGRLYRCLQGNFIMDPCWKEPTRHSVVCLGVPWSTKVRRLDLTRRLPRTAAYGPRLWGLRIGGGVDVNCGVSMGAGGTVQGHPISYVCRRGWVLVGSHPDRSSPLWTMGTAKRVGNHYELRGRKPLTTAWKPVVG